MKIKNLLLKTALLVLLTPAFALASGPGYGNGGCNFWEPKNCKQHQVPEGGSSITYLLVVGTACLGAMALRSRNSKRSAQ